MNFEVSSTLYTLGTKHLNNNTISF